MELNHTLKIFSIFTAMVVKTTAGAMFYFHVSMATHNCSTHEEVCRDLGYDGFAVVSAPEAFVYALKFTDYVR